MSPSSQIRVYATKYCPDCHRAQKILDQRDIPYEYIDAAQDNDALAYIEQVNNGKRIVPTIVFPDGDILVEPSNQELNAKLDALGGQVG